jgi:hypothetical protein
MRRSTFARAAVPTIFAASHLSEKGAKVDIGPGSSNGGDWPGADMMDSIALIRPWLDDGSGDDAKVRAFA